MKKRLCLLITVMILISSCSLPLFEYDGYMRHRYYTFWNVTNWFVPNQTKAKKELIYEILYYPEKIDSIIKNSKFCPPDYEKEGFYLPGILTVGGLIEKIKFLNIKENEYEWDIDFLWTIAYSHSGILLNVSSFYHELGIILKDINNELICYGIVVVFERKGFNWYIKRVSTEVRGYHPDCKIRYEF